MDITIVPSSQKEGTLLISVPVKNATPFTGELSGFTLTVSGDHSDETYSYFFPTLASAEEFATHLHQVSKREGIYKNIDEWCPFTPDDVFAHGSCSPESGCSMPSLECVFGFPKFMPDMEQYGEPFVSDLNAHLEKKRQLADIEKQIQELQASQKALVDLIDVTAEASYEAMARL